MSQIISVNVKRQRQLPILCRMSASLHSRSTLLVFRCNTFHDNRTPNDVCVTGAHWDVCTVTGTLPLSGSVGSCRVGCLASPSPLSPWIYSLHKSIFVIAGCVEQTDTVLHWSSCRPTSPCHQLTICLFLCLLCSSFLSLLLLSIPIFISSSFILSHRPIKLFQPQNFCEGEFGGERYFSSALMCASTAEIPRDTMCKHSFPSHLLENL